MQYLTTNQLVEILNITREALWKIIKNNDDFPYILVGKVKRYNLDEVIAWFKNKEKKVKE